MQPRIPKDWPLEAERPTLSIREILIATAGISVILAALAGSFIAIVVMAGAGS